jgi:hypothetical protein
MTISREMLDALLAQLDATEAHVVDTDPGPAPLAGLWSGDLDADLAEPVIRQIRFDQFVREVVSLGADIALRMGAAAAAYTLGGDASGEPIATRDDDLRTNQTGDSEE